MSMLVVGRVAVHSLVLLGLCVLACHELLVAKVSIYNVKQTDDQFNKERP